MCFWRGSLAAGADAVGAAASTGAAGSSVSRDLRGRLRQHGLERGPHVVVGEKNRRHEQRGAAGESHDKACGRQRTVANIADDVCPGDSRRPSAAKSNSWLQTCCVPPYAERPRSREPPVATHRLVRRSVSPRADRIPENPPYPGRRLRPHGECSVRQRANSGTALSLDSGALSRPRRVARISQMAEPDF